MKTHTKTCILQTTLNAHTQKSSSYHLYLLVRKIKKALGTVFVDAVKSKRRKGALSHTRSEEQKLPAQKNYAWSNKDEPQKRDGEEGKARKFCGVIVGV